MCVCVCVLLLFVLFFCFLPQTLYIIWYLKYSMQMSVMLGLQSSKGTDAIQTDNKAEPHMELGLKAKWAWAPLDTLSLRLPRWYRTSKESTCAHWAHQVQSIKQSGEERRPGKGGGWQEGKERSKGVKKRRWFQIPITLHLFPCSLHQASGFVRYLSVWL